MQLIFLVGMPACGKSSLGRQLSKKLGYTFLDLDKEIIRTRQQSIADIFALHGEAGFRQIERQCLLKLIATCTQDSIIATGGGTPCYYDNMLAMNAAGKSIYIELSPAELCRRLLLSHKRPLIRKDRIAEQVAELLSDRAQYYLQASYLLRNTPRKLEEALDYIKSQ